MVNRGKRLALAVALLLAMALAFLAAPASAGSGGVSASACSWQVGNCLVLYYVYQPDNCLVEWYTWQAGYYRYDAMRAYPGHAGWFYTAKYFEGNRRGDQVTVTCGGSVYVDHAAIQS